jgi:hypothetical protein
MQHRPPRSETLSPLSGCAPTLASLTSSTQSTCFSTRCSSRVALAMWPGNHPMREAIGAGVLLPQAAAQHAASLALQPAAAGAELPQ